MSFLSSCCSCSGEFGTPDHLLWTNHPVRQQWEPFMDLGEGAFSQVVLARNKRDPKQYAALKVVWLLLPDMEREHLAIMREEAILLKKMHHPGIVQCTDVVDDGRQLVLILEWLRGGPLLDQMHRIAGDTYTEQQAAVIFSQIADAVAYMHEMNILHRDMKVENILFAEDPLKVAAMQQGIPAVKIIDLGMACIYNPSQPERGALGSPGFVAPEVVLGRPHTPAMDIYSLGTVLFILLVGRKPFNLKQTQDLSYCKLSLQEAPGLQDARFLALSEDAQDLLKGMLCFDPSQRLTSTGVVRHVWVSTKGGKEPRPLNPDVVVGAANVGSVRRLRNMVHGAVAMQRVSQNGAAQKPPDAAQLQRQYSRAHKAQAANIEKSRGYRGDDSNRGISRLDSMALKMASAQASRMHDSGRTYDPDADISVHYRPDRNYSLHGGRRGGSAHDGRSAHGGSFGKKQVPEGSLKPSSTAVNLSEMVPSNLSQHGAGGSVKGGAGIGPSMQRMGSSLLMGYSSNPSVRGGSVHRGSAYAPGGSRHGVPLAKAGSVGMDHPANVPTPIRESVDYGSRPISAGKLSEDGHMAPSPFASSTAQSHSGTTTSQPPRPSIEQRVNVFQPL